MHWIEVSCLRAANRASQIYTRVDLDADPFEAGSMTEGLSSYPMCRGQFESIQYGVLVEAMVVQLAARMPNVSVGINLFTKMAVANDSSATNPIRLVKCLGAYLVFALDSRSPSVACNTVPQALRAPPRTSEMDAQIWEWYPQKDARNGFLLEAAYHGPYFRCSKSGKLHRLDMLCHMYAVVLVVLGHRSRG